MGQHVAKFHHGMVRMVLYYTYLLETKKPPLKSFEVTAHPFIFYHCFCFPIQQYYHIIRYFSFLAKHLVLYGGKSDAVNRIYFCRMKALSCMV